MTGIKFVTSFFPPESLYYDHSPISERHNFFFRCNVESSSIAIIQIFLLSPCDLKLSRFYCNNNYVVFSLRFHVNPFPSKPWFLRVHITSLLKTPGKGGVAGKEQLLLFPQCFLPVWRSFLQFSSNLKLSSANSFDLKESKICCLGKG